MSYIFGKYHSISFSFIAIITMLMFSCSPKPKELSFDDYLKTGNFAGLQHTIDSLHQSGSRQFTSFELDSIEQLMHAIRRDFSLSENEINKQLAEAFPSAENLPISQWEANGKLEMRVIDGQKRYFSRAVPNLKRLLNFEETKSRKGPSVDVTPNSLTAFRLAHSQQVINACNDSTTLVLPQNITFRYTLSVKPDAVPAGKTIRCWLPAPREGNPRQSHFEVKHSSPESYILAPDTFRQRTFYMEQTAVQGKATVFAVTFSVQTRAQYFQLQAAAIQPYDTSSELYQTHTAERPPHIVFSDEIRALGQRIAGNETHPLKKVAAIYGWISDSIPWASALEYGTIPNIPHYVLENRHGDCGMHTLLFMTLARSQGIPVKWQSGFMLHPGHTNLHDWCEVYYEGVGWVPVDQSFKLQPSAISEIKDFYFHGIDAYRLIVNDDYGNKLYPPKKYPRSEPYDFQRGEVEWDGGNLYFDQWSWDMDVQYQ